MMMMSWCIVAQKGVTPINTPTSVHSTETYAVLIGISNYQNPSIPDLQYADRDAIAFMNWLQSPAGGMLKDDHIILLTNEKATIAHFSGSLDWLMDKMKPGELAHIYFSGHADVETKTILNYGYLLSYDSPPASYVAGAMPVDYIKGVVSTLSKRGCKVILYTDACHAGKLAGTPVGGTAQTINVLQQQVADEIKIMSCQPNEFSLEGKQWGGGRGVFSFHLLEGLTGLADNNRDDKVSLLEIGRYLEETVTTEVAPQSQVPLTVGDRLSLVAKVDQACLDSLKQQKLTESREMKPVISKGFVDLLTAGADTTVTRIYDNFNQALNGHQLLTPENNSADYWMQKMERIDSLSDLCRMMRRNLAIALQDEVQQALNALLEADPEEVNNWNVNPAKYENYPIYLNRVIQLLGDSHYLYKTIKSKLIFFEAYLFRNREFKESNLLNKDAPRFIKVREMLMHALDLDSTAAYIYHALGNLYVNNNPPQTDSVLFYNDKALKYAPSWILPSFDIMMEYQMVLSNYKLGAPYLRKAFQAHPESYFLMQYVSWWQQWEGNLDSTISICNQMIKLKPNLFNAYHTLAHTYWIYGKPELQQQYALKSLSLQQNNNFAYANLIYSNFQLRQSDSALSFLNKLSLKLKFSLAEIYAYSAWYLIDAGKYHEAENLIRKIQFDNQYVPYVACSKILEGILLYYKNDKTHAEEVIRNALLIDPGNNPYYAMAYAWLGKLAAEALDFNKAEDYFHKAIRAYSDNRMDDFRSMEEAHYQYGQYLLSRKRLGDAKEQFEKASEWTYGNGYKAYYGLACLNALLGKDKLALDNLEKALIKYFPIPDPIIKEPLFKKIRTTNRFRMLMKQHFNYQFTK